MKEASFEKTILMVTGRCSIFRWIERSKNFHRCHAKLFHRAVIVTAPFFMTNLLLNILLAEDNENDAMLFEMALEKANVPAKLQIVSDGEQTVAYLKGEGKYADRTAHPIPDFLLLDLNMPRMNGFEVLEWIRADDICKHLIVHVLSASSRAVDVSRVYDLHANSYLVKPSRVNDLVTLIQSLAAFTQIVFLSSLGRAPHEIGRARETLVDK
jgi:CheY-like chemotaxis protein